MLMSDMAEIDINIYNGARQPLEAAHQWSARVSDGRSVSARQTQNLNGQGPHRRISVPFFDMFFDDYTVIVSADDYENSAWFPVPVHPTAPARLDLLALPKDGSLHFANATWPRLSSAHPDIAAIIRRGTSSDAAAEELYGRVLESRPKALACFLNIITALSQMSFPKKKPLDYYWNIGWPADIATPDDWLNELDRVFKQDRFFCYVEASILPDLREAAKNGAFAPEQNPQAFHPDATESYKQTQFDVCNVQLTIHGHDTPRLPGPDGTPIDCVKIEPDIDYYKDLAAHGLEEVIPNKLGHQLTDPNVAYMLRWMAGRRIGADFDPLYTVESAGAEVFRTSGGAQ
jgi:hypothetical protein